MLKPGDDTQDGKFIRPLNEQEQFLRSKHMGKYKQCQEEAQRALQRLAAAEEMLKDLALAFNGGKGPITMTEKGLFIPKPKAEKPSGK